MIEKAKEKIKEEMEKQKNPYTKAIGEYVLKHIKVNKSAAEKIASGEKTIMLSLKEMKKEAKKVAVQGCGMLTDKEGFKIVGQYFGFIAIQEEIRTEHKEDTVKVEEVQIEQPKKRRFHVDMNDL